VTPPKHRHGRATAAAILAFGVLALPAAAQEAAAPCVTCVALLIDGAGAEATLQAGVPLTGVDLVFAREAAVMPALVERLSRAGAHVWLTTEATAAAPPEGVAFATGVFVAVAGDAAGRVTESVFALRRAATELRAIRPELRVGLVLTATLATPVLASDVAPYLDLVWLAPDLSGDTTRIGRLFPGLGLWLSRSVADPLAAGAGLAGETAVIDASGRAPALAAELAALRPFMPPGLTPLPDVRVTCEGCRAEVWMHPETLEAIAVVRGATAPGALTIAPDALRVARADVRTGRADPLHVTRAEGAARVEIADAGDPVVLRIAGWRGVEEEVYRADVRVSALRTLSVEEILARHHARRARQARLVENAVAMGTTVLTFEVPGFAGPVEVTAATTIFTRGALTEVAQHDIRVNGVDMNVGATAPRLPIIEPERVSTPPLAITLSSAYDYRLAGRSREAGRDCYIVAFTPRDSSVSSFTGRAWIEAAGFALVRMEATQTGLRGAIVSSEQHDVFAPVRVGDAEVWLPARSSSFQIYQAAALRTPIHRELLTPRHEVNVSDFDARLAAAHGSNAVMLRDTPQGYRYIVPAKPASNSPGAATPQATTRVLAPSAAQRVVTLAFGTLLDPNISVPLPYAGLSYVDFDFLGTGAQFSGFFGGSFGQAAWTLPAFLRPRWQLTGRAFGIAVGYNDRSFRNGREQYTENIRQRPFRADATVVAPISSRAQVRVGYEFDYTAFEGSTDTGPTFAVPVDAITHGLRVALDLQRGPWSLLTWWNPARRQGWRPWGRPGLDFEPGTSDFQRYGVTASRSWVIAPGAVARLEGGWVDGHDLDRFSRFTFDSFENRLRGYPSASLRFDRGAILRSIATWTPPGRLRLDAFFDVAAVRDPGFGRAVQSYPGLGGAVEIPLPRRVLLALEYGYGFQARNTDGSQGTHVVKITGFKIF
jgi:hypothetical protein